MGKRAQKTAGQDMAARKRKRKSTDGDAPGAGICDDILDNILVRLPTRAAVSSTVLSKHHHRLICSPEFRSLHFRLSPPAPLPHPHIAYVVTTPVKCDYRLVDGGFHSFHVAGGGLRSNNAPMRTLADESARPNSKLSSYEAEYKQWLLKENQSRHLTPDYGLCWGYRPTLVSPGSIVGEDGQNAERRRGNRTADMAEVLKPVNEQDKKNGQTTTLDIIRFMESLIPIMEKLTQGAV
ncbi:hypothetical protein EJB05_39508, partial [Eragrostis curvula]